ncbi:endonuclease III domain-containing protein [Thermovibrio sp.]
MRDLKERIEKVYRRLLKLYPEPHRPRRTPLEQAVFTVLSQNTTDKNAQRCVENLKKLTGGDFLKIPLLPKEKVIEAIRPCGMFNQKYTALKALLERWPEVEKKLKELPAKEGIKLLTSFPFIGSKTARVILTFGFNKNTFPIDTHCKRVLKRLGLIPEGWSFDDFSEFMEENFSGEFNRVFHYNLIRLGREICGARKPRCSECPLRDICPYANLFQP